MVYHVIFTVYSYVPICCIITVIAAISMLPDNILPMAWHRIGIRLDKHLYKFTRILVIDYAR